MNFGVEITLSCGIRAPWRIAGGVRMTDWIDALVRRAKDKHETKRQEDKRFNTEQELKKQHLDTFWGKLTSLLGDRAAEFNSAYGSNAVQINASQANTITVVAQLTSKAPQFTTRLTRSIVKHTIDWTTTGDALPEREYGVILNFELLGDRGIICLAGTERIGSEELAQRVIEGVIRP